MKATLATAYNSPPSKPSISEDLLKIASELTNLAGGQKSRDELIGFAVVSEPSVMTYGALVKRLIGDRRHREKHFASSLFADPVWDIILDLFLAEIESRPISVSSATSAANVPQTTGLRCIAMLTEKGMILRIPAPLDRRKVYLQLSPLISSSVRAYLDNLANRWSIKIHGFSHASMI